MRRVTVLCVLLGQVAGCSFTSMEHLSGSHRPEVMPRCSAGTVPIIADAGFAAYFMFASGDAIARIRRDSTNESARDSARTNLWFTVPTMFVAAASVWYGLHQRDRCADARAAHESWLLDHRAATARTPLAPPPVTMPPPAPPAPDATIAPPTAVETPSDGTGTAP